jgi:exonuclease SbcC
MKRRRVRPTKLEIQGLTAYRDTVEVDFSELDLFAITGETGAGKSSLVDAISFALFGKAPRVGSGVKDLISQGADRLKVSLEFRSNGENYRIYRETGRRGQKPPQIERYDKQQGEWMPEEADRVKDANAFIERLLQMDYEAFVRSVVLPQGQFQEFLSGDRDQRRKVLDRLLDLELYERMARRANAIAHESEREAERIAERLRDELGDATPEALKQAKVELKTLEAQAKELAAVREATEAALRIADRLTDARSRHETATKADSEIVERLKRARDLLSGGQKALDAADAEVIAVQKAVKSANYDPDLHLRLSQCGPLLREIERSTEGEKRLVSEIAQAQASLKKLEAEAGATRKKHADAQATTKTRHDDYEAARHTNAAALLRKDLQKGDLCPVCGQAVVALPTGEKAAALDKLREAWEKAQTAESAAQQRLAETEKAVSRERDAIASREAHLAEVRSDQARRHEELRKLVPDPSLNQKTIAVRVAALEGAKKELDALQRREREAIAARDRTAAEIAAAKSDVTTLETQAKVHATEAEAAKKAIAEAEAALRTASSNWANVVEAIDRGHDAADVLREHLSNTHNEERGVIQRIGASGQHIEQIAANIELAKRLRAEEKVHRETCRVAKDLASLLRIDALPSFIREEALRRLAADGSRRLDEISKGRYEFAVDGQDFLIVDKWNAGDSRSVRTLSGGETFLASLALALALAEQLPALGGHGAGTLESLFIDEGFSHLDADTLDIVASALEVLGEDRSRLIGVITHVPALAERMPARITVHKSQAGSTVTVG